MIRQSPVEAVLTGVIAKLRSSTGLTGLLGSSTGVYNYVPQGAAVPYVRVSSPADRRVDTMSRFGAELLVNVHVVSQAFGDKEGAQVLDQAVRALSVAAISTTGPHTSLGVAWENSERYSEVVNGVEMRHHVGIFRVWAEQTS